MGGLYSRPREEKKYRGGEYFYVTTLSVRELVTRAEERKLDAEVYALLREVPHGSNYSQYYDLKRVCYRYRKFGYSQFRISRHIQLRNLKHRDYLRLSKAQYEKICDLRRKLT